MAVKAVKTTIEPPIAPPESVAQSAAPDINLEDALIACFIADSGTKLLLTHQ